MHILKGDPNEVIPALVEHLEIQILGLGTVARTGLSGLLLGNTAEALLHTVDCSVIVVKPEGFVSPISDA